MFTLLLAAYIAGQSGDHLTTIYALNRPALFRESNVLKINSKNIIPVKLTINVTTIITAYKIRKQHRKVSYLLFAIGAVSGSYATVHNIKEMR